MIDVISAVPVATASQLRYQLALLGAAMLGSCVGLTGQASPGASGFRTLRLNP